MNKVKRLLRTLHSLLVLFGIDPVKTWRTLCGLPAYLIDYRALRRQQQLSTHHFPFGKPYPCLDDRSDNSGTASGHYFHQDLLVARRIHARNPHLHVDVGSRIDGFVAHVAAFRTIEVVDIRPLTVSVPNIRFLQADFMTGTGNIPADYCDSLSCLHALEHFGLGRYGDPLVFDGYLAGFANLTRILQPGGRLYFAVPIGPQRIEFNAHRVFAVGTLLAMFAGQYEVERVSYVDDAGDLHENIGLKESDIAISFGCNYGCGIFELVKR